MSRLHRRSATVLAVLGVLAGTTLASSCGSPSPQAAPDTRSGRAHPATTTTPSTAAPVPDPAGSTAAPVPAAPSPPTPPAGLQHAAADRCAERYLRPLTLAQSVAQLFDVGVPAASPGAAGALVRAGVGGVFLQGRSTQGLSAAPALAALQQSARTAGTVPPHISADEEGGAIQSVRGPGIPEWPAARTQSTWSVADLATRSQAWAGSLHALGITLDLAPVADVVVAGAESANPPIGALQRDYGSDPDAVADRVAVVVHALQTARVAATVKHFPGLGRVRVNTDAGPAVDPLTTRTDPALLPFTRAVQDGVQAVMVSSATYPQIDPGGPGAFSARIITDLLRGQLGFQGMVVSDDLANAGAVAAVPVGARAVAFLRAGGDLVVIVSAASFSPMVAAVTRAARSSPAMAARVHDAALHVLASKVEVGLLTCGETEQTG